MRALRKKLKSSDSPDKIVLALTKNLEKLKEEEEKEESEDLAKVQAKISEALAALKFMLYGDADTEPKDETRKKVAAELNKGCLLKIILQLGSFDFEGKKDAGKVANHIIRRCEQNGSKDNLLKNLKDITNSLIKGYDETESALPSGSILQEIVKHETLTKKLLEGDPKENVIFKVMSYVEKPNFDIASDAFTTLKILTTRHKGIMAKWLEQNYDLFFSMFNELIKSNNYVTRRQSLRLLGEILLERKNFNIMMKYIQDRENLKLMMTMLKEKSQAIQFEAFHVFKVFVANPKQTYPVKLVLWNNKNKLIKFLGKFQSEREDQQFMQEKELVINHLKAIQRPEDPNKPKPEEEAGTE